MIKIKIRGEKSHQNFLFCDFLQDWKNAGLCEELALPKPNEFIPDSFALSPLDPAAPDFPTIIRDTPYMRVWHKQDDEFFLPKLYTAIEIGR